MSSVWGCRWAIYWMIERVMATGRNPELPHSGPHALPRTRLAKWRLIPRQSGDWKFLYGYNRFTKSTKAMKVFFSCVCISPFLSPSAVVTHSDCPAAWLHCTMRCMQLYWTHQERTQSNPGLEKPGFTAGFISQYTDAYIATKHANIKMLYLMFRNSYVGLYWK